MVKERNIALCILFTILTCGLYGIYWFICLTDETNNASRSTGTTGGMAFLLSIVTCSIYLYYWMYKQGEKLESAKASRGIPTNGNSGIIYIILTFVGLGIVSYALMQNDLNKMAQ